MVEIDCASEVTYYSVDWDALLNRQRMSRVGWGRNELTRVGGDLQVGDWVRATGTVEPFWSCEKEELDAEAGVIVDEIAEGEGDFLVYALTEADVYECHAHQLTRITRAEALA